MNIRKLRDISIFCLSVWAIFTIVSYYFDVYILFPFTLVESNEIPYKLDCKSTCVATSLWINAFIA